MSPKDIPELSPEENKYINDLYKEMHVNMCNYATIILKNPVEAEDVVQDTFALACEKGGEFFTHPNPNGWLMNTLKNNINNHCRNMVSMTKMLAFVTQEAWVKQYAMDNELEDNLSLLYGDLAKYKEYELLKKHVVDGYQIAEIAQEYGIGISCCKLRVFRAKRKLREILQKIEI